MPVWIRSKSNSSVFWRIGIQFLFHSLFHHWKSRLRHQREMASGSTWPFLLNETVRAFFAEHKSQARAALWLRWYLKNPVLSLPSRGMPIIYLGSFNSLAIPCVDRCLYRSPLRYRPFRTRLPSIRITGFNPSKPWQSLFQWEDPTSHIFSRHLKSIGSIPSDAGTEPAIFVPHSAFKVVVG